MFEIFTDTDCDVTPEVAKKYNMHLISMPYSIDGNTTYPYKDFDVFDSVAFYNALRNGTLPKTSAISAEEYYDYFKPVLSEGKDILYVHFSSAMTMTFGNMKQAVAKLKEEFPDRTVYDIDTKGITTISYNIVCEVGDMAQNGKTVEEIMAWAEKEVDHFAMYFFADDLKFFRQSGRVSGLAATLGTLVGIRPIIHMSQEGKMVSVGKEKGRRNAVNRLLQYVEELGDDVMAHRVVIGHTDAEEIANDIKTMLIEKYGDKLNVEVLIVNPTAGSHCGPNGVGITFHAIHR